MSTSNRKYYPQQINRKSLVITIMGQTWQASLLQTKMSFIIHNKAISMQVNHVMYADGCIWLASYDFLLVFSSDLRSWRNHCQVTNCWYICSIPNKNNKNVTGHLQSLLWNAAKNGRYITKLIAYTNLCSNKKINNYIQHEMFLVWCH